MTSDDSEHVYKVWAYLKERISRRDIADVLKASAAVIEEERHEHAD